METPTTPAAAAGLPVWAQILLTVMTFGGGIFATVATIRAKKKEVAKSDAQLLIDQYQEGRKEDRERLLALEEAREQDRKQMDQDRRQLTKFRLYVFQLHKHISDGNPPPPPAWPEDLL